MSKFHRSTFNGFDDVPKKRIRPGPRKSPLDDGFKRPLPPNSSANASHSRGAPESGDSVGLEPWVEAYGPQTADDLAVNQETVRKVRAWLLDASTGGKNKLCLLSGPSGAGKTATIKVLCRDLGLSCSEWTSPDEIVAFEEDREQWARDDFRAELGQKDAFFSFLQNASVSGSVIDDDDDDPDSSKRVVVLVDEFPNAVLMNPSSLVAFLSNTKILSPIVFIVSENPGSGKSGRRLSSLFPDNYMARGEVVNIKFNAVASTFLIDGMNRLLNKVRPRVCLSPEIIGVIAELSNGDIRMCINGLQFAATTPDVKDATSLEKLFSIEVGGCDESVLPDTPARGVKRGRGRGQGRAKPTLKKTREKLHEVKSRMLNGEGVSSESPALFPLGDRDGKQCLFSTLGKILYAKRIQDEEAVARHRERAEEMLRGKRLEREPKEPAKENAENILDNSPLSSDGLGLFLHQHYLNFFENIQRVSEVSSYFSLVDAHYGEDWRTKDSLTDMCSSLLVRGILQERYEETKNPIPRRGVYHFTKPKLNSVISDAESNRSMVNYAFYPTPTSSSSAADCAVVGRSADMFTVEIPMLKHLKRDLGPSQRHVVSRLTSFKQYFDPRMIPEEEEVEDEYFEDHSQSSETPPGSAFEEDSYKVAPLPKLVSKSLANLIEDFED